MASERPAAFAWLARALSLESAELPRVLHMGALVAVLVCAYTIAKVLRDSMFLSEFGALALPQAYIAVAIVSVAFVAFEVRFSRPGTAVAATRFQQTLAVACALLAAIAYPHAHRWTTALFYLWTGSQAMMLIPRFWMLALELWDSRRARAVFPLLAGCGIVGGVAGGALAGWSNSAFARDGLLWTLPVLLAVVQMLTISVDRHRIARTHAEVLPSVQSPWRIVARSSYIRIFVAGLALSVIVGTLVDFQFKVFLHQQYGSSQALTSFLGRFYVGLNVLSLVFQFGIAGWLLRRMGLGVSTGLQPAAVLALSMGLVAGPVAWAMIALRWTQGVLSQTLGKSCNEIYYTAIPPSERRRIKPALDTLIERWSDAGVGVLLLVVLRVLHLGMPVIVAITALLSALWVLVLILLDRQYGRAFQSLLNRRWTEADDTPETVSTPSARRALLDALKEGDARHVTLALQLCRHVRDPMIAAAVRGALLDERPAIRAAAISSMEALGLRDPSGSIAGNLTATDESLRRAAVSYLLFRGQAPVEFARGLLAGEDRDLQRFTLDALFDRPAQACAAVTLTWIDARVTAGTKEDLVLAGRALGIVPASADAAERVKALLAHPDLEVRRAALLSAASRPWPTLVGALLGNFLDAGVHHETREAVAALGDVATPALSELLGGAKGYRARGLAAGTLARIGTPAAVRPLHELVRNSDPQLRHLGLRALARVRVRTGSPVLARAIVHRLFLRELREYRSHMDPALALADHAAPAVRLLAESHRESADMALERAVQALACWYEPAPLAGVLDRLRSSGTKFAAPALEYLEHILPRATFLPVRRLFEAPTEVELATATPTSAWIEAAWRSDDTWLRACAVRASGFVEAVDPGMFRSAQDPDARVRAELEALAAATC